MGSTTVDLIKDLEEKFRSPDTTHDQVFLINKISKEARNGEFHDFWNEKYPAPKMELRRQLLNANLGDLADKVVNGEYDDEAPDDVKCEHCGYITVAQHPHSSN
jgi:hypothetical protein